MQLGGIGKSFGALNTGLGANGPAGGGSTSVLAANDSSGDIYASVYQAGSDEYMMDDGSLDVYA